LRWRAAPSLLPFCALCLLAGLGLGVHLSLVLMLPGLAVVALAPPLAVRRPGRLVLAGALCGLLGASVYAYLPLRYLSALALNPARDYWQVDLASWSGLWWMVSGAGFRHHPLGAPAPALLAEIATFVYRVWSNFLGLPALLGVVGLVVELRRRPWVHLGLVLMLVGHLAFSLTYAARDKEAMFLPAYLLWGIWIGLGMRAAAGWTARLLLGTAEVPWLGAAALAGIAALLVVVNFRFADLAADRSARQRGEAILGALAPDAVFVGAWPDLRLVEYLQYVEGQRPDIAPVDAFFSPTAERARRIADALASGRPVYVTACRDLPAPTIECEFHRACQCFRLHATSTQRP
jgi:hypothetical protein